MGLVEGGVRGEDGGAGRGVRGQAAAQQGRAQQEVGGELVFFDFADNDVLKAWLKARAQQMAGLQLDDPSAAARTAVQLIQVISDILGGLSLQPKMGLSIA